jgi:DNA-binding winged helix-turn-helix (wHTH) protein
MSPEPSPDEYRFGDFVLDVEKGFLRRAGGEIRLQPKAFELLRYLVERPGRVVSKTELTDAVWRGTAITDNSLSQCAAQVRRALGDESQTIIRTVARRGYVFAAPLTSPVREFPKIVETRNDGGLQSAFQRPAIEAPGWFRRRWLLPGIAAAAAVIAFTAWSITRGPLQHDDDGPSGHFVLSPPEGTRIALRMPTKPLVSVAPDGKKLVLVAEDSAGIRSLWLRLLSATIYQRLDETQGASQAFWSPDSRFVAFFAEGKLKKIPASGGSAQTICEAGMGDGEGGSWSPDDVVVFAVPRTAPAALPVGALYQVPAAGGPVRPATTLDKDHGELSHTWPQFLPDGRHFLYLARNQNPEQSRVYVQKLGSSERHPLLVSKTQAVWARGHGGGPWLFFPRDRVLMAQPVDLSRLEVYGQSVAVASNVNYNTLYGTAAFSVSENGVLAWRSGTIGASTSPIRSLAWYARQGQRLAGIGEPGVFSSLVLSPDERRVAVDRNMKKEEVRYWDIWTIELATGVFSRLTQGPSFRDPVWSPDSRSIAAVSRDGDRQSIVDIPVGSGIPRLLTPPKCPQSPKLGFLMADHYFTQQDHQFCGFRFQVQVAAGLS